MPVPVAVAESSLVELASISISKNVPPIDGPSPARARKAVSCRLMSLAKIQFGALHTERVGILTLNPVLALALNPRLANDLLFSAAGCVYRR